MTDRPLTLGELVREIVEPVDEHNAHHFTVHEHNAHRFTPARRGTLIAIDGNLAQVEWASMPDDVATRERDAAERVTGTHVPLSSIAREVIHLLDYGEPLCRVMPGTPRGWPPGHVWARVEEADRVTCPECRGARLARRLKATAVEAVGSAVAALPGERIPREREIDMRVEALGPPPPDTDTEAWARRGEKLAELAGQSLVGVRQHDLREAAAAAFAKATASIAREEVAKLGPPPVPDAPVDSEAFSDAELEQFVAGKLRVWRADSYTALRNTIIKLKRERDEARRLARHVYPCTACGRETVQIHEHDTAHGIAETHMAGSERFRCTDCGKTTYAHEPGAEGMRFVLDKPRSA